MPKLKKFIETHWLFYAFQGLASLAFGGYLLFTNITDVSMLASLTGVFLLFLGIVELFSMLYRKHYGGSLILSLILSVSEVAVALSLLFTADSHMVFPLTITAIYTLGRGILELFLAFTAVSDKTDRFMWAVCGICGAVIGFVILNSGVFSNDTFFRFFSTYMMIYGITNLIYGIHNKNELIEQKESRAAARAAKTKSKTKTAKKAKSAKKAKKAK